MSWVSVVDPNGAPSSFAKSPSDADVNMKNPPNARMTTDTRKILSILCAFTSIFFYLLGLLFRPVAGLRLIFRSRGILEHLYVLANRLIIR